MKIILTLAIFCITVAPSFAQTKKFKWTSDLCEYESLYDAKKYSLAELRDTVKLFNTYGLPINFDATPMNINDVEKLDAAQLESQYSAKKRELQNLKLVKSPYFEKLRQDKLKELESYYSLSKTTVEAYKNPSVLKNYAAAPSCVGKFADSLIAGGDSLLNIWLVVNKESRAKNGDPDRLRRRYEEQLASPDKFRYARNEVMTFGWWNCANNFIPYVQDNGRAEKEFKKLFKRTKESCDEP